MYKHQRYRILHSLSFRTRDYYKEDAWDETGIDLAFWKGYEKPDFLIRFIIAIMIFFDIFLLLYSIFRSFTLNKILFLLVLILLLFFIVSLESNLTILHLEYKRIDILRYKVIPIIKPLLTSAKSYYLVDFESAKLSKSTLKLSPFYTIKLKFMKPKETVRISFRADLPYRLHKAVYYGLNKKCSDKVSISLEALEKFYPYFELKGYYQHQDYRYLLLLSLFLAYFIFSFILPTLIA